MSWSETSRSPAGEPALLDRLRAQYEAQGFRFLVEPKASELPEFLGGYRPDAIAQRPDRNVAIEIKSQTGPQVERSLQSIRRLFDGHDDWQFTVVYGGRDLLSATIVPVASPEAIRERVREAAAMLAQGHRRAAFIAAWSLLEAALHRLDGDAPRPPRMPGTVVERLAMLGMLEPEAERRLRGLIAMRNRIVHGDIAAEPSAFDVETVLQAVDAALQPEAA